jgi:CheY-like chemotaxis protein
VAWSDGLRPESFCAGGGGEHYNRPTLRSNVQTDSLSTGGGVTSEGKRVLVVDDDYAIRSLVADALELEGYQVSTAVNGAAALDQLRAGACPDAVVIDLMMPVMDGQQFLEACRAEERCLGTPVLVMSAYRGLADLAPELKASACIAKPFDIEVLLGAVERLLRRQEVRAGR